MSATDLSALETILETAFENRDSVSTATKGEVRDAVETALELLDGGKARVAERGADGVWKVNQWLKKAVLLSFRLNDMASSRAAPNNSTWWDKVPSKFEVGARASSRSRLPRRAELHRAPLGLYRQERRADAVLRQSRRLCR
jgi:2,3,4,5-tetrahydropyridine-2-carboxylate N-succinyltransferase